MYAPYAGFGQFAARNLTPARSTVQAAGLPKDALVEIELVAALGHPIAPTSPKPVSA